MAAPSSYTKFQENLFYDTILPVLTALRNAAYGKGCARDGIACDDVPLRDSDWGRIMALCKNIVDYAEDAFGLYIVDDVFMHVEVCPDIQVNDPGGDAYYLLLECDVENVPGPVEGRCCCEDWR